MVNHVVWFDIPVSDLDRAIEFYSNVLAIEITNHQPDMPMAVFSHQENQVSGCLALTDDSQPSLHGPLLYFNANARLDQAIAAVEKYGGKILQQKHSIGSFGYRALVVDSEGNRIALHAESA